MIVETTPSIELLMHTTTVVVDTPPAFPVNPAYNQGELAGSLFTLGVL